MQPTEQNEMNKPAVEMNESGELQELGESELDTCSGGANLFEFTNSGFDGKRLSGGQMTFAGPEGAGTVSFFDSEEVSSFVNRAFGVSQ